MYESLGKMVVIFKLMKKRAEMEERFRDFDKNWMTGTKFKTATSEEASKLLSQKTQAIEQDIAQYCY